MREVRPGVDESAARRIFERKRPFFWSFASARRSAANVSLELVHLPTYLIVVPLRAAAMVSRVVCTVDGISGTFGLFDPGDSLRNSESDEPLVRPKLFAEDAEKIARDRLLRTILNRRSRDVKPVPGETESVELLQYPYWVYYYRRRRGIDFRVLDAATGKIAGNKIKFALVHAFKQAAAERGAP